LICDRPVNVLPTGVVEGPCTAIAKTFVDFGHLTGLL
jgi:hypothetical protein